jgi:hypothetical protein
MSFLGGVGVGSFVAETEDLQLPKNVKKLKFSAVGLGSKWRGFLQIGHKQA